MKADISAYLESWGLELSARQNRVRQLIGPVHWLSDGHHKEAILREFISRYLPLELDCSTGFIRGVNASTGCSPEVDILIFDRKRHLPYFQEGGVSIVDAASVIATTEVKSSFSAQTIKDASDNIRRVRSISLGGRSGSEHPWSGLLVYDVPESRTLDSVVDTFAACLLEVHETSRESRLLPTCAALGQDIIVFPTFVGTRLRLRSFECKGLAFACALCDLLGSLANLTGTFSISGFDEWGGAIQVRMAEGFFG